MGNTLSRYHKSSRNGYESSQVNPSVLYRTEWLRPNKGGEKMSVPFTVEEFLGVFQNYNLSVWPLHILIYLLGLAAVFLTVKNSSSLSALEP